MRLGYDENVGALPKQCIFIAKQILELWYCSFSVVSTFQYIFEYQKQKDHQLKHKMTPSEYLRAVVFVHPRDRGLY